MNSDLAWAAGLFDGEGTFYIAKESKGALHARMKLGMCHQGAVDKFASIMGVGNVVCEHKPSVNANFKQFRWSVSGQRAVNCAVALYPYLVVKQHEAKILIEWEPLIANGRNKFLTPNIIAKREDLYNRMLQARSEQLVRV